MIGASMTWSNQSALVWCAKSTPSAATRTAQHASKATAQGVADPGSRGRADAPATCLRYRECAPPTRLLTTELEHPSTTPMAGADGRVHELVSLRDLGVCVPS